MTEHRIQWYDCETVVLTSFSDAEIKTQYGGFQIGDDVVILHGAIELGIWEVEDVQESGNGFRVLLCDVSIMSSCSMTSEEMTIEAGVRTIREILERGGCCGSRLRGKDSLKRKVDQAFKDAGCCSCYLLKGVTK